MKNSLRSLNTSLAVLFAVVALVSCGKRHMPETSDLSHNADEPSRNVGEWAWFEVSNKDFKSVLNYLYGLSEDQTLAEDHPMVERVQYWVDQIDSRLRATHPEQMRLIPKPHANVVLTSSINAFVLSLPVCMNTNIALPDAPQGSQIVDRILVDASNGTLQAIPTSQSFLCLDSSGEVDSGKAIQSLVNDLNKTVDSDCKFSFSEAGNLSSIIASGTCEFSESMKFVAGAEKVASLRTLNQVTLFSGLFTNTTEEQMVAILSHELGHYYKSHATSPKQDYDYFYKMKKDYAPGKPARDSKLQKVGEKAVLASTLLNVSDGLTHFEDQEIRSDLFMAAGSLVRLLCEIGEDCPKTCEEAHESMNSQESLESLGLFPFQKSDETEGAYASLEEQFMACFKDVTVDFSEEAKVRGDSIPVGLISRVVKTPVWPSWFQNLNSSGKRAVSKVNQLTAIRILAAQSKEESLSGYLKDLSNVLIMQDLLSLEDLKTAHKINLGQYTYEQEADDLAAEWLSDMGINPHNVVEAMREIGSGRETSHRGFDLGSKDCDVLYKRDWLDSAGAFMFVPLGDFTDNHHSICFRMFNLTQEIRAHQYEHSSVDRASADHTQTWSELVEQVQAELADLLIAQLAKLLSEDSSGEGAEVYELRRQQLAKYSNDFQCSFAQETVNESSQQKVAKYIESLK